MGGSDRTGGGADKGWAGAAIFVLLVAFVVIQMRNGGTGSLAGQRSPATTIAPRRAAPPATAPALALGTAAAVLPGFDWRTLRGVAVDHDVTADGRFVLQVANRADDTIATFEVPESIWRSCPIPSEFDGARESPCSTPR